jgi:hydroxymethylglutaryl-CoA lyase
MTAFAGLPEEVTVYEVGPRDGLQNEDLTVATSSKLQFIDLLADAGLPVIEITSFVRPGLISQLSDAEELVEQLQPREGVRYTALVPNLRGMERATPGDPRSQRLSGIALFTAASQPFSRKNTNASIEETFQRFAPVVEEAKRRALWIRGYVSVAFGCPYQGEVPVRAVVDVASRLLAIGADEIAVSDTIGAATPRQVDEVVGAVLSAIETRRIALHFHDTRGTALANVLAGLLLGVSTFDSSAGGLGGCPYAPGAAGNLSTEDLVYMLNDLGIRTGVNLERVVEASRFLASIRGKAPSSRYYQAAMA